MQNTEPEPEEEPQTPPTHRRRKEGVQYKLRVVDGGQLVLVEERPRGHWLEEWARSIHFNGWGL